MSKDNRLNEQTIPQLTTEHSEKIDIKVLGDQLAILQHIATLAVPSADHKSHNSEFKSLSAQHIHSFVNSSL